MDTQNTRNGTAGTDGTTGTKTRLLTRTVFSRAQLKELAEEVGCGEWHLRAVLNGRRRPGPELAAKLKERGIKTRKLRCPRDQWT